MPKDKIVKSVFSKLNQDFVVVGKSRVKSWHGWLILGIVTGIAMGIVFVANRG